MAVPADFVLDEGPSLDGVRADVALLALAAPVPAEAAATARDRPRLAAGRARQHRVLRPRPAAGAVDPGGLPGAGGVRRRGGGRLPGELRGVRRAGAGRATRRQLVAVVSAIGRLGDGGEVALAVAVAPRLEELRATLAAAAPGEISQ